MEADRVRVFIEEDGHLPLAQPERLVVKSDVERDGSIRRHEQRHLASRLWRLCGH